MYSYIDMANEKIVSFVSSHHQLRVCSTSLLKTLRKGEIAHN